MIFVRNFDLAIFITCVWKVGFQSSNDVISCMGNILQDVLVNISNSVKSLFQLQTLGMCSSNPNVNASSCGNGFNSL